MSVFERRCVRVLVMVALSVVSAGAVAAQGKVLRYASAFDPQTMDPHALALQYHTRVVSQIYEGLVNRDRNFRLEPSLAVSWARRDATTWRFVLRQGVRFHDGAPFTADDVVFSITRALQKTSQRAALMRGITGARKVGEHTVDVLLAEPDAVLPEKLWLVAMMSRPWAEKHGVTLPQDFNGKQETHAVRHANGTGPFVLKRHETDVRTVLAANPAWWGRDTAFGGGNVDEVQYLVIQSDASRLAAFASGQVDLVIDPPFQDLPRLKRDDGVKAVSTGDIGTQYLAFDQHSVELAGSDARGRNPFKDLRVRRAIYHAIDMPLIVKQVLRGEGEATGSFFSPLLDGYLPEFERRLPHDPAAARVLLKDAGYEKGFSVRMDCLNVAFRAGVCQAVAAMLDRIGIKVSLQLSPTAQFFPRITQATASFMEFGWSPGTDPWGMLNATLRSHDGQTAGGFNGGRYSNPKLDALIDGVRVEPDTQRRRQMLVDVQRLLQAELPMLPLYRRHHNWVMRKNVSVVQWPNDVLEMRWVRVD